MAIAGKENINVFVHRRIAEQFRKTSENYLGKLGLCFSAAMLMFLESDPRTQADYINKVFRAELDEQVENLLAEAKKEQLRRIKEKD